RHGSALFHGTRRRSLVADDGGGVPAGGEEARVRHDAAPGGMEEAPPPRAHGSETGGAQRSDARVLQRAHAAAWPIRYGSTPTARVVAIPGRVAGRRSCATRGAKRSSTAPSRRPPTTAWS